MGRRRRRRRRRGGVTERRNQYTISAVNTAPPLTTTAPLTRRSEKYVFALGQSPEGFALMKTDPLRLGSKVSKFE
jgi:hypothetical protein